MADFLCFPRKVLAALARGIGLGLEGQVRVVACRHGAARHGRCAVCGLPCEPAGHGHLLRDGERALGDVCLWCLDGGPLKAAARLRRRAAGARQVMERWRLCLHAWGWTGLHRLLLEYAAYLDALAGRVERSDAWGAR
jgi:hypothetical protein